MRTTALFFGCALLITACGSRSLPLADSTTDDSAQQQADAWAPDAPDTPVRPDCPGDPNGVVCDIYLAGFSCPPGAQRTVLNCRPLCQDKQTCAEVPVLPPTICATNDDCQPTDYCQKDGHCVITGAIAGMCQPRPQLNLCPIYDDVCPDVCGCDGKTHCDACHAHAAGVSVATSVACFATTCAGLETAYAAELKNAKQCCVICAWIQCTTTVPGALGCGCDTMVNVKAPGLQAIQDEWTARGCMFGLPPCGIKCQAPTPGACQLDGYCADGWN